MNGAIMGGAKGCRRCVWIGLLFSGALHAAIAAALLHGKTPDSPSLADRTVTLDLAMFGDSEGEAANAQAATEGTPESLPLATLTEAPAQAQEQEKEPARETKSASDPALPIKAPPPPPPSPVLATKQARKAPTPAPPPTLIAQAKPSKPKPAKASRPKPKPKPKPKPRVKPRPKSVPAAKPVAPPKKTPATRATAPKARDARSTRTPASNSRTVAKGRGQGTASTDRGLAKADAAAAEHGYLAALRQAIARHQKYPNDARRKQRKGVTMVAFVIQSDGRIRQIRIAKSSGHSTLDRAALKAMHRLDRFKPIPAATGRKSWALQVPIRFDLR